MATHRRRQGASRLPVGGAVGAKQDGRGSPMAAPMRALLGFAAAAVSVLTFHQGTWALLHAAGLMPPAPYPTDPVPPLGVPRIANFCFWAGLYGAAFGFALPRLPRAPMCFPAPGPGLLPTSFLGS